ncbi:MULTISPECIES: hypothetical protein [unclassified Schlesneria]|uniref:hypothetical protein n=1 Tax=Schlesneria TaxID=656899 RepID=UPI002F170C1F
MSKLRVHRLLLCLTLISSAATVGCGKAKQPWDTVYPATGVLLLEGKPLAGAQITLIPEDSEVPPSVRPTATTEIDGSFELGTYSKSDGAPAGSYKVLALHYPIVGSKENPSAGPNDLPKKYASQNTTDLKIEVTPDGTEPGELILRKK